MIENAVPAPPAPPARTPGRLCRFLMLGQMDVLKGIDDLLTACTQVAGAAQFELVLAGPPGTAGDAKVLAAKIRAQQLAGIVRYVGPVRGAQKEALFCEADVYVQPSHREGMPIALLEALA